MKTLIIKIKDSNTAQIVRERLQDMDGIEIEETTSFEDEEELAYEISEAEKNILSTRLKVF